MNAQPSQVTLHNIKKMAMSDIDTLEGKCVVLVNGKVTPETALKLIEKIGKKPVGAFVRDLIVRFVNGGFKQREDPTPQKKQEIPEYFKVLHQLFGEVMKLDTKILLTAIKNLKMTPAQVQTLQKEAKETGAL